MYRRRQWHPTPVLLPGKSHGWRSLVGCSPWGLEESDTTEQLHFHFSLSCIGEGNGNPLQCSCLENPRDGGAWWAVIYGVAQSRTQLKWLSSSSSILPFELPSHLLPHPTPVGWEHRNLLISILVEDLLPDVKKQTEDNKDGWAGWPPYCSSCHSILWGIKETYTILQTRPLL